MRNTFYNKIISCLIDITVLNFYIPNYNFRYKEKKNDRTRRSRQTQNYVGYFNTPLSLSDRTRRQISVRIKS